MNLFTWIISAVLGATFLVITVTTNDQATGESLVQSTEASLTSMGYTITNPYTSSAAPEIDAASGTSAIALLTGVLLLLGERFRSRRS